MTSPITTINERPVLFYTEQERELVKYAFGEAASDSHISLDEIGQFRDNPPEKLTPAQLDSIGKILNRHGYEEIVVYPNGKDPVIVDREVVEAQITDMGYRRKNRHGDKIIFVPPAGSAYKPTVVMDADDGFVILKRTGLRLNPMLTHPKSDAELLLALATLVTNPSKAIEVGGIMIGEKKLNAQKEKILKRIRSDAATWQLAITQKHFANKTNLLRNDLVTFWFGTGNLNISNQLGVLPSDMYLSPQQKREIIENYITSRTDYVEGQKMRDAAQAFLDHDATTFPHPEPPPADRYVNNVWQQADYFRELGEYDKAIKLYTQTTHDDYILTLYAKYYDIDAKEVKELLSADIWMCRQLQRAKKRLIAGKESVRGNDLLATEIKEQLGLTPPKILSPKIIDPVILPTKSKPEPLEAKDLVLDELGKALKAPAQDDPQIENDLWETTKNAVTAISMSNDKMSQQEIIGLYLQYIGHVTGTDKAQFEEQKDIETALKRIEVDGKIKNENVMHAIQGLAAAFAKLKNWHMAAALQILCLNYEQNPEKIQSLHEKIGDLFVKIDDSKQALEVYAKALNLAGPDTQDTDHLHFKIARLQSQSGHFEEAIEHYDAAIALTHSAMYFVGKGVALQQWAQTIEDEAQSTDLHQRAIDSFKQALVLDRKSKEARHGVARSQVQLGNAELAAKRLYPMLIKNNPNDVELLVEAAELSALMGQNEQALDYYQRAVLLIPLNDQMTQAWKHFNAAENLLDARAAFISAMDAGNNNSAKHIRQQFNVSGPQDFTQQAVNHILDAFDISEGRGLLHSRIQNIIIHHPEFMEVSDKSAVDQLWRVLSHRANPKITKAAFQIAQIHLAQAKIYLEMHNYQSAADHLFMAQNYCERQNPLYTQIKIFLNHPELQQFYDTDAVARNIDGSIN
jgi:tetratricopeptide (TPR) repeat protein